MEFVCRYAHRSLDALNDVFAEIMVHFNYNGPGTLGAIHLEMIAPSSRVRVAGKFANVAQFLPSNPLQGSSALCMRRKKRGSLIRWNGEMDVEGVCGGLLLFHHGANGDMLSPGLDGVSIRGMNLVESNFM